MRIASVSFFLLTTLFYLAPIVSIERGALPDHSLVQYYFGRDEVKEENPSRERMWHKPARGRIPFAALGNYVRGWFGENDANSWIFERYLRTLKKPALFLREEVSVQSRSKELSSSIIRAVERFSDWDARLRERGAKNVVFVPIPTKLSIASLAEEIAPAGDSEMAMMVKADRAQKENKYIDHPYQEFIKMLQFRGLKAVDLFNVFRRASRSSTPLFLLDDTHWSSFGIAVSASETYINIFPSSRRTLTLKKDYTSTPSFYRNIVGYDYDRGDLHYYLMVPRRSDFEYEYGTYSLPYRFETRTNGILFGSSYSCYWRHGFRDLLQSASKGALKLDDRSCTKPYPWEQLEEFLKSQEEIPELVIIEIPFRWIPRIAKDT